jgi:hypothetical protein
MCIDVSIKSEFSGYNNKNMYAKRIATDNGFIWSVKSTKNPIIKRVYHATIGKLMGNEYKHGTQLTAILSDSGNSTSKYSQSSAVSFSSDRHAEREVNMPSPLVEGSSQSHNGDPRKEVSRALEATLTDMEAEAVYCQVKKSWKQMLDTRPNLKKLNLTVMDQIISVGGLNLLIEQLKSKPGYKDVHCFVCDHVEDLKDCMIGLKDSSFEGKVAFIVRAAKFRAMGATPEHVTPVLIEKRKGETRVMIMDSLGTTSGIIGKNNEAYGMVKNGVSVGVDAYVMMYLNNVYVQLIESQTPNIKIYLADQVRQKDMTNCSIFSFLDVKMFFKNKQFFEEVERFGAIKEGQDDPDIRLVTNLPPENMKIAQSLKILKIYFRENPAGAASSWFGTKGIPRKQVDLEASLAKGIRAAEATQKEVNMKSDDRYHKYLYTMQLICEEHSDREVAELSVRYSSVHCTSELLSSFKQLNP